LYWFCCYTVAVVVIIIVQVPVVEVIGHSSTLDPTEFGYGDYAIKHDPMVRKHSNKKQRVIWVIGNMDSH
jgi:hypothetical protein